MKSMPSVSHKNIEEFLTRFEKMLEEGTAPSTFLIYGEEALYKSVLERVLEILVPGENRNFMYEPFEGLNENVGEALRSVNTYALLQGRKVVSLLDSRIFYSKQDTAKFLEKAHAAHARGEFGKAAGTVMSLLGMLNLSMDDMAEKGGRAKLGFEKSAVDDGEWLDELIAFSREHRLAPGQGSDPAAVFIDAMKNGLPGNHFLIVTTDTVDKRKRLFKCFLEMGQVIDCSVPKGDRKADRTEQEAVLRGLLDAVLEAEGKTMSRQAFATMVELTGFDPRTFSNDLAKLVDYVGARREIGPQDVEALLRRTRSDPIYSFTNALTDADAEQAFFYMRSLLGADYHPLQILAALANHLRKLLVIRDFLDNAAGVSYDAAMPFNFFRSNVMPRVEQHDQMLKTRLESWREQLSPGGRKKKMSTDLLIAPNPRNAFPVYKLFQKAHGITLEGIVRSLAYVREADGMLKSSRQSAEAILDWAVVRISTLFRAR